MHRRRTLAPTGYNSGLGFAYPGPRRQADGRATEWARSLVSGSFIDVNLEAWRVDDFDLFLTAASKATKAAYKRDLKGFIEWSEEHGHSDPFAIGRIEIRGWAANESIKKPASAPATISRKLSALRRYFGWLHQSGLIKLDPTTNIRPPKGPARLPRVLQQREIDRLFAPAIPKNPLDLRDRLTIELLYGSGLRVSELCRLDAINFSTERVAMEVLGKGDKTRRVPINAPSRQLLNLWIREKPNL